MQLWITIQCVVSWLTGIILFDTARRLLKSDASAWIAWLFYLILAGMSPWVSLPYTDSFGILLPILMLWIVMTAQGPKQKTGAAFLIGLLAFVSFKIKPQTSIMAISIVMISIVDVLRSLKNPQWLRWMTSVIAFLAGLAIAVAGITVSTQEITQYTDPEKEFGWEHYLMMGMDPNAKGTFHGDDVIISLSFPTKAERHEGCLNMLKGFLQILGVRGVAVQFLRKLMVCYQDGTFGWWRYTPEIFQGREARHGRLTETIRSIYQSTTGLGTVWRCLVQTVWMALVFFNLCAAFSRKTKGLAIAMLAVIGLTMFELLFEAGAKYILTYIPVFSLFGAAGLRQVSGRMTELIQRNRK